MKPVRLLLLGLATLVALLVAVGAAAFNSRVQTWAARRALAARPELHATLGSVSAGLGRVEVRNLRVESHGAVLTLPALNADLPLISAGLRHKILVTRLVAKGWTLDLTKAVGLRLGAAGPAPSPGPREFSLLSSAYAADPAATATTQFFQGIFAQLQLPVDLALDGVDLAGEVILPGARGDARITFTGGGLAAGHEGTFAIAATAALTSTSVATLEARATFVAAMDTPRTFTRFGAKGDATASGSKFPRGVKLSADLSASRAATGENYLLTLATEGKQLLDVRADFPTNARKLDGTWKLDVRDTDLAPFTLGRALPVFDASGEGRFDTDAAFGEIHAAGRLDVSADKLAVVQPGLAAVTAVRLAAEFDLAQRGDTTRVERLNATLSGAQAVATMQSLQAFEFALKDGEMKELKVADPARELLGVVLQGVPVAWAQPFLKDYLVTGGDLRGELVATARNGGFALRTKSPLAAAGLSVALPGRPLLRAVDVSLNAFADYTPKQGWQAELAPLVLKSGATALLTVEAKAGQLTGKDQPIKMAGKFSVSLPAALAQPVAAGMAQLVRGDAAGEFAASVGATQEIEAKLALTNLAADPKLAAGKLPDVSADVRADVAANGQITLNAPLLIECDGRKSDLAVVGTLTPGPGSGFALVARVTSTLLIVDDAKILAVALAPPSAEAVAASPAAAPKPAARETAPPWAGVTGQLALALKKVVYSDKFQLSDVSGTVRLDAGALKFDGVRADLGHGSDAKVSGSVTFDAKADPAYALAADLAVTEFDPAPLFRALNPGQPATVEGKFTVTSKLAGQAAHLADFATQTHGDFQLASKGGICRILPVNVSTKVENTGRLAAGVAFVGSAFDALKGRKDDSEITSTAKAVAEVSKLLAAIPYDQLSLVLTRDAALNTVLREFTLISPEMRLTGGGQATHRPGISLLEEALAMEFKLRARGHTAELFKYLGKLETDADALGYAGCTLPLKVGGTLGQPDTSELNNALVSIALEKSGVKDKAADLLNKLLGGGK